MGQYIRRSYHTHNPPWRREFSKGGKYIGIEFEVEARSGGYSALLESLPDFPAPLRPVTERDASLSEAAGVEIVFPPFLAKTLKKRSSTFAKAVASIAPNVRNGNGHGMHMNVNTRGWHVHKQLFFTGLINNLPERYLQNLGQRPLNGYCRQARGMTLEQYAHTYHCAASYKAGRIELRFPRSTTDHFKFQNLIDFITYVEKFSEGKESLLYIYCDWNRAVIQFEEWMCKNKNRNRLYGFMKEGYPNG